MTQMLKPVNPEKIFKLANGMTISSIRQLLIILEDIDQETFLHHVNSEKNDFAIWIRDVFDDEKLAGEIQYMHKKEDMVNALRRRILDIEKEDLESMDITTTQKDLAETEDRIEEESKEGKTQNEIKIDLLKKGVPEKEIDFILENIKSPIKDIKDIEDIENLEEFQEGLKGFKSYIMESIIKGRTLEDVQKYLVESGWNKTIVKMLIYDVYKAHTDLEKLSKYIHDAIAKGSSIQDIKLSLMQMGWKEYVINSVLYGIHNPSKEINTIVTYLGSMEIKEKDKIEEFLLKQGWKKEAIQEAFKQHDHNKLEKTLESEFNIVTGWDLVKILKIVNKGIAEIQNGNDGDEFERHLKNALEYRRLKITDFTSKNYELYAEPGSQYFYNMLKIQEVEKITGHKIKTIFFANPTAPLITETSPKYLIAAELVLKKCVYCGSFFRMNNLEKIMKWDESKTHKVAMYVCKEHFPIVKGFFEEKLVVNK